MLKRLPLPVLLISAVLVAPAAGATVDGMPIHWSSTGKGAKAVVFVHGWTCDSTSWDAQVPVFSKGYRVLTVDLPGHGKSGAPKDGQFSMALFARAVEAVRVEAGVNKIVLVGHSMGTPVILEYTRLYPQRVAGLVAVDGPIVTGGGGGGGRGFQAPAMTGPEGLKAREGMVRGMFIASTPQAVQDKVLKMMLGAPEATANGARQAMFTWMATPDETVRTFPVLGLYADKSRAGNRDGSRKLFPAFEYTEIPDTGHFLMMEKPDAFNQRLSTFLAKVSY